MVYSKEFTLKWDNLLNIITNKEAHLFLIAWNEDHQLIQQSRENS